MAGSHRQTLLLTVLIAAAILVSSLGVGFSAGRAVFGRETARVTAPLLSRSEVVRAAAYEASSVAVAFDGRRFSPNASPVLLAMRRGVDLSRYASRPVSRAPFPTNRVAISFDDGPSKDTTGVLEILDRYHAHGTFFFPGARMVGHEDVARAVMAQGSEIGNHTWMHTVLFGVPYGEMRSELEAANEEIRRVTGEHNVLVRPRAGTFDATGLKAVRDVGGILVLWDVEGGDTVFAWQNTPPRVARNILKKARGGSIILMHETNPEVLTALPQVLATLERRGLTVVTVSELLSGRGR